MSVVKSRGARADSGATLAAGHDALSKGDWARARACFERALAIEESAEALEGLGMAAWWLGDAPIMFDARERAFRLYGKRRARREAGRVAMTLAEDHFYFRGEAAVASGWYKRAHSLLDPLDACAEQGWLRLWEGDFAAMLGEDPARVRALAAQAAAIGKAVSDLDLQMAALALEGLARVTEGDLREGMPRLDEATAAALSGEMNDFVAVGMACCYLVIACERIRDFDRAAQWCRHVKKLCERWQFNVLLAVCRAQHASVLMWRGAWTEAEQELLAVVQNLGELRPAMQAEGILRLAQLRRLQGRLDDAGALLKQVEGHPLAGLERTALALDRGDPATAAHLARRMLVRLPAANQTERVAVLELAVRATVALGKTAVPASWLRSLRACADALGTAPLRAGALVAEGLVAAAAGKHQHARDAFEEAIPLYARSGGTFEAARAKVELARSFRALGNAELAQSARREALNTFQELGAAAELARTRALLGKPDHGVNLAPGELTTREMDVLGLVAQGLSNQQIAGRLHVSPFTIKRHVANILTKLELPSRAAAAAYAARRGVS